jgi:hypothetical protein
MTKGNKKNQKNKIKTPKLKISKEKNVDSLGEKKVVFGSEAGKKINLPGAIRFGIGLIEIAGEEFDEEIQAIKHNLADKEKARKALRKFKEDVKVKSIDAAEKAGKALDKMLIELSEKTPEFKKNIVDIEKRVRVLEKNLISESRKVLLSKKKSEKNSKKKK